MGSMGFAETAFELKAAPLIYYEIIKYIHPALLAVSSRPLPP
jgi:hypothetical protein